MDCNEFSNCISDPLAAVGATPAGWTLGNFSHFAINLVFYLVYASLFVAIIYYLVKTVYALAFSDTQDMYEKFRQGLTNAVFAAFGMMMVRAARFIPAETLRLLGITDNPFANLPF